MLENLSRISFPFRRKDQRLTLQHPENKDKQNTVFRIPLHEAHSIIIFPNDQEGYADVNVTKYDKVGKLNHFVSHRWQPGKDVPITRISEGKAEFTIAPDVSLNNANELAYHGGSVIYSNGKFENKKDPFI